MADGRRTGRPSTWATICGSCDGVLDPIVLVLAVARSSTSLTLTHPVDDIECGPATARSAGIAIPLGWRDRRSRAAVSVRAGETYVLQATMCGLTAAWICSRKSSRSPSWCSPCMGPCCWQSIGIGASPSPGGVRSDSVNRTPRRSRGNLRASGGLTCQYVWHPFVYPCREPKASATSMFIRAGLPEPARTDAAASVSRGPVWRGRGTRLRPRLASIQGLSWHLSSQTGQRIPLT